MTTARLMGGLDENGNVVALSVTPQGAIAVSGDVGGGEGSGEVSIVNSLPAGDNNIGNVDVVTMPPLPAGTNNIGDIDVLTLPVAFNSGASNATTQRVVAASDSPEVTSLSAINTKIPAAPSQDRTSAIAPSSVRLTDGTAFYKATTPADTQPISAASLPLPTGAAQDRVTAIAPNAVRLSDGTNFYQGLTEGTDVTGATIPSGGSGARGWLSAIWSRLATAIGLPGDAAATSDTGSFNLNQFIQRLLNIKLPATLGTKTAANSFAVIPASDYTPQAVGNVASGTGDSGNPVKIGGVYQTTRPTYSNNQRGNIGISVRGGILADFEDYVSNPNNINAADVGSSTTAGANGQNIITGNPTNNSTATVLFSGNSSFSILISGTWVGTLQFERTLDNGTTWTSVGAFSAGTNFITQTTTANGAFHGNASSSNGIRVRATAWTSGVASVRILLGQGTGTITIGNPLRLFDGASGSQGTIKPANTLSVAGDTALVVAVREGLMPAATSVSYMGTSTGANLKTSAGNIYAITCTNLNTSVRYFQIFDKASDAAPGDTPVRSFPVYGNGGLLVIGQDIIGGTGIALTTGISWGISTTALVYTAATAAETIATVRYA